MASERDPLSKRLNTSSSKRSGTSTDSLLDRVPLINILSRQDRQRVMHELSEARYGKDDFIFREGDPTEYFHIVKEGTVKCVKSTRDGKECTIKMLMPGDNYRVPEQEGLVVIARDGGLLAYEIDGKDYGILGTPGEILVGRSLDLKSLEKRG